MTRIWPNKNWTLSSYHIIRATIGFILVLVSLNTKAADTTSPVVTITSSPSSYINSSSASFSFSATDSGTGVKNFACSKNGGKNFFSCSSPKVYLSLSEGTYNFIVRATDKSGNSGIDSKIFVVDTTKPVATLLNPISTFTTSVATFAYSAVDNGGGSGISLTSCGLDSLTLMACDGGSKVFSGLANGSHIFSIITKDKAGNLSLQINFTFTVSVVQPSRGHYLSFGGPINLKDEVTNVLDNPNAYSTSQVNKAKDIDGIIRSIGIKGFWIPFDWDTVEVADNIFNWKIFDDNLYVANRYNKKLIMKFSDRSFNGRDIMPDYFAAAGVYSIPVTSDRSDTLGGYISKRWDSWVYTRIIRLLKAGATKYKDNANFAGLVLPETATGQLDEVKYNYNVDAYVNALINIVNQSKIAFVNSKKLFFYVNFLRGGQKYNLALDKRTYILDQIMASGDSSNVVLGGPDVMADDTGHADSVNLFYILAENKYPNMLKACHAQFNDYKQKKSNTIREDYRLAMSFYPEDLLRSSAGSLVQIHPTSEIGAFWSPYETFRYAKENFDCNYFFWHYKTTGSTLDINGDPEYRTRDVLPVIQDYPNI